MTIYAALGYILFFQRGLLWWGREACFDKSGLDSTFSFFFREKMRDVGFWASGVFVCAVARRRRNPR